MHVSAAVSAQKAYCSRR